MEPTVQSTIQQQPVNNNQTLRFVTLLLIGIIGLIGAYFVITSTFKPQNKAATRAPELTCSNATTGAGYCHIKDIPDGVDINDLYLSVIQTCPETTTSSTAVVYRQKIKSRDDKYSDKFDVLPGCTYKCQIEIGELGGQVCPGGDEKSLACGPTPTPPCKCDANKAKLCPPASVLNDYPIEWEPIYESKNACFQCEKIIIKDDTGVYHEEFSCDGGRKARLHQAKGEGCREYEVIVKGKLNGQPAEGGADCNCKQKMCCPVCKPPEEVKYSDTFVPPGDPNNMIGKPNPIDGNGETVIKSGCGVYKTASGKEITCDITPPNACAKAGSTVPFELPNNLPKIIKVCYDDVREPGGPNELNGKCVTYHMPEDREKIKHLYQDAGRYDIALWCPLDDSAIDDNGNSTFAGEVAVCIKRITIACQGGGGGGSPTPTVPTQTPTATPTPGKCPQLKLEGVCI